MNIIHLFTDASVQPQAQIGVGGFCWFFDQNFQEMVERCNNQSDLSEEESRRISEQIQFFEMKTNKSTFAEISSFINALKSIEIDHDLNSVQINVYSDCQSLGDLLDYRLDKLVQNNFMTKSNKKLSNAQLYQDLYEIISPLNTVFFKVKGHSKKSLRTEAYSKIFSILDIECRKYMRSLAEISK